MPLTMSRIGTPTMGTLPELRLCGSGAALESALRLDAGYLNQFVNGRVRDTQNHVIQLALFSRF